MVEKTKREYRDCKEIHKSATELPVLEALGAVSHVTLLQFLRHWVQVTRGRSSPVVQSTNSP